MKHFKKIIWVVLVFNLLLLTYVIVSFQVDDMTLSKGKVHSFNNNWTMVREDGERTSLEELAYLGKSEPEEVLVIENTIPKEYFGMTMSFLSADKTLKVWMDEKIVYEFGTSDVRGFGHTPGSVVNFIDIPLELKEGKIRIEMISPYKDYGARVSNITIGERDVLILQLLQDNLFNIVCNLAIVICGIIFFILYWIQKFTKQNIGGVQYLCGYCIVTAIYYFIETKILHIFYGNQTLYSVLVFLCIMLIPFFIGLYYGNGILGVYEKRWKVLLGLICANICIQMVLQLTNLVDFMNMCGVSHALIALTVLVAAKSYMDIIKDKKKDKSIKAGMAALLFMGIGGTIDIVRMYVIAVGDMGKFSRLGTAVFAIIMLYQHLSQIMTGYSRQIEENAMLLKNEIEYIEKKNEQLRKANELAEEARQDAIAADAAKGRFLAHMSHEIRTPINAVLGMDTMILRESKDMQIKEYALDIQNAGHNLLALINDILDFSKIESGKLEIIQVEYDFSSLIHDISNMIKAKAEGKNLKLYIHVNENLPSKLLGDDVRIRQVVVNLLNNAVKYTQEGSVALKVNGRIEGRKVVLDFVVEDTGIGIKEEDIEKLFQEFERIEEKRNRNVEGTGLGINITTQLLLLMGSKLKVESVYGKGSKFYFTLEQQIVDSTPVGNLEERIQQQSTEYSYMATFAAPEAQLLVVDDNAINLKVFVSLLKSTKVNVDVADSGKACLEMVERKHYDLIFLDHMMPEMDGIETLHRMKELENNQSLDTPVVALTANAITGAKEMYLSEGFDAFLPKPINSEKLEQMILRLLPRELLLFDVEEEEEEMELEYLKKTEKKNELEFPIVDGMDWNYGLMHLPIRALLLDTIGDFCRAIHVEADALNEFYLGMKEDIALLEQYRIQVHSMKSSANLIGVTILGGMAGMLEKAARDGDIERIDAVHDIFLQEWRSYKVKLSEAIVAAGGEPEIPKQKIEDYTIIFNYLERLQSALEELDVDEMDENMGQLEEYDYPESIQRNIEKLSVLVMKMDSEKGNVVIQELKKQMKEDEERRN